MPLTIPQNVYSEYHCPRRHITQTRYGTINFSIERSTNHVQIRVESSVFSHHAHSIIGAKEKRLL